MCSVIRATGFCGDVNTVPPTDQESHVQHVALLNEPTPASAPAPAVCWQGSRLVFWATFPPHDVGAPRSQGMRERCSVAMETVVLGELVMW